MLVNLTAIINSTKHKERRGNMNKSAVIASSISIGRYEGSNSHLPEREEIVLLLRDLSLIMENLSGNERREVIHASVALFFQREK